MRQKSLPRVKVVEIIGPVYQEVPHTALQAYPVSVRPQSKAEQQALDGHYFDSAVEDYQGSQSVGARLVDGDSRLPTLVVQQEESDSVSVVGDFYFAETEEDYFVPVVEGYIVQAVEGYIVQAVERYIVLGELDSYFLQLEEETFLSWVVILVVSILHGPISQHHFPVYFSFVCYPNSTSTWYGWKNTFVI